MTPKNSKTPLEVGKCAFQIDESGYYYHCCQILQEIIKCKQSKKCKVFHFLQQNHFAFDSLLYDGTTETVVLIQITINRNHTEQYEKLYQYINLKPNQNEEPLDKYHNFFILLFQSNLVQTYMFQWLTDKIYEEISKKTETFYKKRPEANKVLTTVNHSKQLLNLKHT